MTEKARVVILRDLFFEALAKKKVAGSILCCNGTCCDLVTDVDLSAVMEYFTSIISRPAKTGDCHDS